MSNVLVPKLCFANRQDVVVVSDRFAAVIRYGANVLEAELQNGPFPSGAWKRERIRGAI